MNAPTLLHPTRVTLAHQGQVAMYFVKTCTDKKTFLFTKPAPAEIFFQDFCTNILGAHFLCGLSRELDPKCHFHMLFLASAYMPQLSTTGSGAPSFDSCGFWCIFRTR